VTRPRLILAGAILLALAGSFAAGRYTRTVATRDVVRTETQWRDREVVKVVHDVQVQHDVATQTRTVTVTRWAKAPDGTPVVTQESHQERDTAAETKSQAQTTRATERTAEGHATMVETHTAEARPRWSATALVGLRRGDSNLLDAVPLPLTIGGVVARRVWGPASLGGWVLVGRAVDKIDLAGGVAVRLDW
jgi:hypothetical protein